MGLLGGGGGGNEVVLIWGLDAADRADVNLVAVVNHLFLGLVVVGDGRLSQFEAGVEKGVACEGGLDLAVLAALRGELVVKRSVTLLLNYCS